MRFFKYLVFTFLLFITANSNAVQTFTLQNNLGIFSGTTADQACTKFVQATNAPVTDTRYHFKFDKTSPYGTDTFKCFVTYSYPSSGSASYIGRISTVCPPKNSLKAFYYPKNSTNLPNRVCDAGCTYEGGHPIDTPNFVAVTMQATGDSVNCSTNSNPRQPPTCDTKNPYGDCYVPPNDDCVRLKDGSIHCPDQTTPPTSDTCGGATYCKKPPTGCGEGYVSGSFNGQELCVKSGPSTPPVKPNDPNDPNDPNKCSASYCPKPDDNKDCPEGYYTSTYNGQKICVKDNPNPNQPNPNHPNNNDGGDDGGGASEPTGGDNGSTGSVNLKPVIDAINSLKSALLTAFETLSRKLSSLVDGQKESNEHLKNIKSESVKTNEKLDTSNGHLDKIEEATQATSTAVGETNKKLDQIFSDQGKEQIEQLGEQSTDSRLTAAETEMTSQIQQLANKLSYSSSHACISDFTVTNIPHFGSMTVPLSKWCDLLALVKLLLKLAVLMLALKMIDATVRTF